jgi:hypothetical protein
MASERWRHLCQTAFQLEDLREEGPAAAGAALALVDSALEVFTSRIDPTDDLEGYAVRRLLLALRPTLSELARHGERNPGGAAARHPG